MPDYTKTTGSTGTMMIRDTGYTIEFWFKAGYSSDWANDLDFNWTANGSTTHKAINYPTGANWAKVGEVNVSKSQTIAFRLLDDTGTQGMGGPTTFNQYIDRASRPDPPSKPAISNITASSVHVKFSDGDNNGASITSRQIAYSQSSGTPAYDTSYPVVSSDRSTTISGLDSGETYYFWARTGNSEGYSSWSSRASAKTLAVPEAPSKPLLSSVTATSVDVSFSANGNGGSTITAYQIGYGTNSSTPTTTVSASSPQVISGLSPGTVYYIRVRARNSVGWSSWSSAASIRTIAGAYIKVGATWKLAVPYVRVGGVWKVAEPWVRSVGVWKRTI